MSKTEEGSYAGYGKSKQRRILRRLKYLGKWCPNEVIICTDGYNITVYMEATKYIFHGLHTKPINVKKLKS